MNEYMFYLYKIARITELHRLAEKERSIQEFSPPSKINGFGWVLVIILVCSSIALFTFLPNVS